MTKKLSDMTLEELWVLFPILLTEHKAEWTKQYQQMEHDLQEKLHSRKLIRISHIGSTAIASIWAKPIVDILVEIALDEDIEMSTAAILSYGFIKMSETEGRKSFNYGYTTQGFAEAVFHLHLRYEGDNNELYFRDYLNEHPDIAHDYEKLKLELWHKFEHDRDAYTEAKRDFVTKYTEAAKKKYGKRY